jgi:hypothetical protein
MKSTILLGLGVGLANLFVAMPFASAATFDFAAIATNNEHGALSETFTNSGISVTGTSRDLAHTISHYIYLDGPDGPNEPGGLGVCKNIGSGECTPGNDDNLSFGEVLELTFDVPVEISFLSFSNGVHVDNYLGNFGIAVDSTPTSIAGFTQYLQAATWSGSLVGTKFSFISNASISGNSSEERVMYISSLNASSRAVPEPMTASLLGISLIGFRARRRAAKS